jgi:hypothetical protein
MAMKHYNKNFVASTPIDRDVKGSSGTREDKNTPSTSSDDQLTSLYAYRKARVYATNVGPSLREDTSVLTRFSCTWLKRCGRWFNCLKKIRWRIELMRKHNLMSCTYQKQR